MEAALVTGAAKRIGRSIAEGLARDGWHVHVHYRSSRSEAEQLVGSIRAAGGSADALAADLASVAEVQRLIAACDGPAPLGCLINSAAAFEYDRPTDVDPDRWQRHVDVNLRAPVLLSRAFHERVQREDRRGCIINMLDNKVFALNPDFFSYTVSKAALQAVTVMHALAFAPRVRVCGIAPGITLISGRQTEANFREAHRLNPLGRGCEPEEIVEAVRFILRVPAFSGQVLTIDGGQSLWHLPRDVAFLNDE